MLIIENNAFGYEYSGSKIINIANCNIIKFYSSKDNNKIININSKLEKDETIKFYFQPKEYNPFKCIIAFRNIVSEPDLETFNKYPNNIQNSESEALFNAQKGEYIGKQSTYKIIVNNELTTSCEDECELCQKTGEKKCLANKKEIENEEKEEEKLREYLQEINSTEIDSVIKNLDLIISKADPDSTYIIKENNFTLVLKNLDEYFDNSNVNLNFSDCEKKLRENLPSDTILRIVQINIPSQNEKILNEQVEYKIYDQNNKKIDLSICINIPITVENKITNSSKINMDKILELKNSGIDPFNIKEEFFNDICMPYSDNNKKSDMILSDRVNDLYQNFSVCGDECEYISFNDTKLSFKCICNIKQEISSEFEEGNFSESKKSGFFNSNFGVIKCYKLFFSSKGKLENIGFLVFTIIILGHIPIYIFYIMNKINPIKAYLAKEMENTGYTNKNKQYQNSEDKKEKESIKEIINFSGKKIIDKYCPPKKANKKEKSEKEDSKDDELSIRQETIEIDSKNPKKLKHIIKENFITTNTLDNIVKEKVKYKKKDNKEHLILINAQNTNKDNIPSNSNFSLNNYNYEEAIKYKKKDNIEHLILINALNTNKDYMPANSNYNLDNYNYEEAIKYEKRSYLRILYIFLMSKEKILNTFVYQQPLELKPLRICIFLFNLSIDIALNALFYLSDNISDKYHYKGNNQFLFSLTNNIAISVVSTIIGFILIYLFQLLIQSTNKIKKLFKEEEQLMKKNKEYKVNEIKKIEIENKIEAILKFLKIKIIIFFALELIIMLFFLYYITVFCHVYKNTQISWIYNILISYIFSFLVSLGVSLVFSFIYLISCKKKIKFLYMISLIDYQIPYKLL